MKKIPLLIRVNRVKDEFGELSLMSPHSVIYNEIMFRTCEALFQWLRFVGFPDIQWEIWEQKSPMGAKMKARKHRHRLNRGEKWDQAPEDITLMKKCILLKLEQHPELKDKLIKTGSATIIEDCTSHDRESARFWGMVDRKGEWLGENNLGRLWMEIRNDLRNNSI